MCDLLLKEIRVKQWIKNLLIFASPLFGGVLLDINVFLRIMVGFICFCMIASCIYIINDVIDCEKDKNHPVKCRRPIASGALSKKTAFLLAVGLFCGSVIISSTLDVYFMCIIILYFVMNILYSWKLKNVVFIDIFVISIGFVLRALSGVFISNCGITRWFILCIFTFCLFLALGKRRCEILNNEANNTRKVLEDYSVVLIDNISNIVLGVMLTSYALFSIGNEEDFYIGLTFPIVLYCVFRYMYLIHIKNEGEKPEDVILKDKGILVGVFLYFIMVLFFRCLI